MNNLKVEQVIGYLDVQRARSSYWLYIMAEPLMYSPRPREWVVRIEEMLDDHNSLANEVVNLRVATPLLNMKPEAYVPQIVCLGPYHNNIHTSSVGSRISTAEAYKVKSSSLLSQKLGDYCNTFDDIVKMVEQMLPGIGRFYDWPLRDGEYSRNFALAMTVDSFFLLLFLC